MNKIIRDKDIRVRKGWGNVRPFTRVEKDVKKESNRRKCRGKFRHEA